jgi:hypothetical protein
MGTDMSAKESWKQNSKRKRIFFGRLPPQIVPHRSYQRLEANREVYREARFSIRSE